MFHPLPVQGGDSDDDVEGFPGSDDTQPSGDGLPPASQDLEGISTYGEDDLVPEPHRVSRTHPGNISLFVCVLTLCFCRLIKLRSTTQRRQRRWT